LELHITHIGGILFVAILTLGMPCGTVDDMA
jgi:hypothetical protein